jgi:beta-1,2-rhamnosyltransferase WsaF-like protein
MRQSDIWLSLMLSPHPSYPPLEMASCGGIVVANTFDCKTSARLQAYSQNSLSAEPHIQSIADALSEAVARIELGLTRCSPVNLPSTWPESFLEVLPQLVAAWNETTQAALGRQ